MKDLYERIKESLNLRTLYGLIALGCLLGFAIIGRIDDAAAEAQVAREAVDARLARHGGAVDETLWMERANEAEQTLAAWQTTHWSAPTAGVIAAELQSSVTSVLSSANLRVLSVKIDPEPTELPTGAILRFRFATESRNGDSVAKTLAALAAHEPMIVIDEVNAVFDERKQGRFSASGYVPINIEAAEAQESS